MELTVRQSLPWLWTSHWDNFGAKSLNLSRILWYSVEDFFLICGKFRSEYHSNSFWWRHYGLVVHISKKNHKIAANFTSANNYVLLSSLGIKFISTLVWLNTNKIEFLHCFTLGSLPTAAVIMPETHLHKYPDTPDTISLNCSSSKILSRDHSLIVLLVLVIVLIYYRVNSLITDKYPLV